nr:epoxide hydrolase [Sphingomonas sp. Y57]
MTAPRPFVIDVAESALDDLRARLANVRWPDREVVDDWSQGVPLDQVRALVDHWANRYDWRRCERMLNAFGQYRMDVDGLGIHFIHARSKHVDALPLLITHGWPGSVIEFHKIIGPLVDPTAHGGRAEDAFHVIAPSLPGYAFSDKPRATGTGQRQTARLWITLMRQLGYRSYVAQGGDWGALVTTELGALAPPELRAIHLNMQFVIPAPPYGELDAEQQRALDQMAHYGRSEAGYSTQQATRPQTLGYGLADSPVGQAAWIFEKLQGWSDCDGNALNIFSYDEMLDNIMLYWLTNSATSAARFYWESYDIVSAQPRIDIPVGCSLFPKELFNAPRSWADDFYSNIIHWNKLDKGGHFAAFEQPETFVRELRTCFAQIR